MSAYRIFVGAFPTGEIAERIQRWREPHDPITARITAPHVTLAGTYWRHGSATPENEAAATESLLAAQPQLKPFELVLGGVESFLPEAAVIYLRVTPTAGLSAARRVLLEVLGQDKHRNFVPHLTLVMRLPQAKTEQLWRAWQQTAWHTEQWAMPVQSLWLMQRGEADTAWRYIQEIKLLG
jgi:2'-5' RNA ligase